MLKRYSMEGDCGCALWVERDDDGDWVEYKDALNNISELTVELTAERDQLLRMLHRVQGRRGVLCDLCNDEGTIVVKGWEHSNPLYWHAPCPKCLENIDGNSLSD